MTDHDSTELVGRDPDSQTTDQVVDEEQESYFVINLGNNIPYAFQAEYVDHVAPVQQVLRVPTAPDPLFGIVYLRQRIVTVVDITKMLSLSSDKKEVKADWQLDPRFVVLDIDGVSFAIKADKVFGISDVSIDSIKAVDQKASQDESGKIFGGQFEDPNGVVTILRADVLVSILLENQSRVGELPTPKAPSS